MWFSHLQSSARAVCPPAAAYRNVPLSLRVMTKRGVPGAKYTSIGFPGLFSVCKVFFLKPVARRSTWWTSELTTELIFCGLLPRDRHYLGSSIVAGLDKLLPL